MKESKETPKKSYKKASKEINRNIKAFCEKWEELETAYNEQLKNEPNSWAGIGRGSELEELQILTEKMTNMMKIFV